MSLVFDPQIIGAAGPQSHNLDDCVWQSPALRAIICRIVVAVIMQSAHLKTGQGESLFQFPDTTSCLAANLQFSENPQNRPAHKHRRVGVMLPFRWVPDTCKPINCTGARTKSTRTKSTKTKSTKTYPPDGSLQSQQPRPVLAAAAAV